MAYVKQNFVKGQILTAEHMNHIEDGIVAAADAQSLGGVAAESYALKTDVAPDSALLGGKAPAYYLQPRNLLDNSDFTNPVNQRDASSYSGNFIRSIDRWLAAEGPSGSVSVKIEDGGITFTTSGGETVYLIQRFEKGYLDLSKQHTIVAYMADGTISFNGYIDTSEETMDGVNVTFPSGSKIKCVALYEGVYTADTLPPYIPKGYTVELMACQQYYRRGMQAVTIGKQYSDNTVFSIVFPKMRVSPTVQLLGIISQGWGNVDENTYQAGWSENRGSDYYINFASSVTDDVGKTVVVVYESSADL